MNQKIIGSFGENIAKKYLIEKGYEILATNWHSGHKEIDIIAYKNVVIGLEIKTRTTKNNHLSPLKAKQLSRIRLSLRNYCYLNQLNYNLSRIDLILIQRKSLNIFTIKHYLDI